MRETDSGALERATEVLKKGGFVVAPTDTLYGILANATDPNAVLRLYRLRRPSRKPFIVLSPDIHWVRKLGLCITPLAMKLLSIPFMTVVLKKRSSLFKHLGTRSVAVRIPKGGFVRALLERIGGPLVAPSANREGEPPAENVEKARLYFGENISLYIEGRVLSGKPSAIIDLSSVSPKVLRRGPYSTKSIERILNYYLCTLPKERGSS